MAEGELVGRARHADLGPPGDAWEIFELQMVLSGVADPDGYDFTDEQLEYGWKLYGAEIMNSPNRPPGDRPWGYWIFELGIDKPETRLERVLELDRRGLLTDDERNRIAEDAERAAKPLEKEHVFISPDSAREWTERRQRERRDEALAIAAALSG